MGAVGHGIQAMVLFCLAKRYRLQASQSTQDFEVQFVCRLRKIHRDTAACPERRGAKGGEGTGKRAPYVCARRTWKLLPAAPSCCVGPTHLLQHHHRWGRPIGIWQPPSLQPQQSRRWALENWHTFDGCHGSWPHRARVHHVAKHQARVQRQHRDSSPRAALRILSRRPKIVRTKDNVLAIGQHHKAMQEPVCAGVLGVVGCVALICDCHCFILASGTYARGH